MAVVATTNHDVNRQIAKTIQPDAGLTDAKYAESTSSSYVTSIASEFAKGILENQRVYAEYGKHSYGMPMDDEELDRLDLNHRKYELLFDGRHFLAPINTNPTKILDLGTGTGLWALDVADLYPGAQVIGTDIAPVQPQWTSPNCQFEMDDMEADWTYKRNSFDFIHIRDPLHMVRDWPRLVQQMYDHLKPGGYAELSFIYPSPKSDDGSMPMTSGYYRICRKISEAAKIFGADMDFAPLFSKYLRDQGFVQIEEHVLKLPVSPWAKDERMKKVGALELANVLQGASGFAMRAFTQAFGMTPEEVEKEVEDFRRDARNKNYHQYCDYYVVYGRKPESSH